MTDDELKRLFDSMRQENAAAHSETRRHVEVLTEGTRRHVEVLTEETRRHFDVVTEGTRKDIQLVAESVQLLSEKLDRTATGLDEKIDRTAAETQSMIKFSHVEIDRRMRSLEDAVANLQLRVERLEGSTH